jgi:hypothetical protein
MMSLAAIVLLSAGTLLYVLWPLVRRSRRGRGGGELPLEHLEPPARDR